MTERNEINLDLFEPRDYQQEIIDNVPSKYKKALIILPRRAGKDLTAWNILIYQALIKAGVYYYCLPTYSLGRKIVFDSLTNHGVRFLDYIPKEAIRSINIAQMKIVLKNKSIIQILGADNFENKLVGTNCMGCVLSEYAIMSERVYFYLRPIILASGGWMIFLSTPRGRNHLYHLYELAQELDDWYVMKKSIDETRHIPLEEIEKEREDGIVSEDLIQQEYYCSFIGVTGSYYGKYIDKMRAENRITYVPYDPSFPVHTSWDLGYAESTVLVFFQIDGNKINIINYYENCLQDLAHYVKVLQHKDYVYGKHILPHDGKKRESIAGQSRIDFLRQLGLRPTVLKISPIEYGIERVRATLPRVWIDSEKCDKLVNALENYRQEYDHKLKVYKGHPLHDWSSHACDAVRYMALGIPLCDNRNSTPEELKRRQIRALYGEDSNIPVQLQRDRYSY